MIFPEDYYENEELSEEVSDELVELADWAVNDDMSLDLSKGAPYLVRGEDALRQWIKKSLRAKLDTFAAYSEEFGAELPYGNGEVGREGAEKSIMSIVEKCLLKSDYIISVDDWEFSWEEERCNCSFTVSTIYGEVKEEVETDGIV